jgi:hypothetical protein
MLSINPRNYPEDPSQAATEDLSPLNRFWLFAEHALTLTVISIVVSLLTFFLDARWFVVLAGVLLLGLHRSRALKGMNLAAQVVINLVVFLVATLLLWPIGQRVNESRDEAVTLVDRVIQLLKPQPAQQRTETPAQVPPSPKPPARRPVLTKPPGERDGEAFNIERPVILITGKHPGPSLPLDSKIKWAGFQMNVENRGRTLAQNTELFGKMVLPDRRIGSRPITEEIDSQCQRLPIDPSVAGPSIAPSEPKLLTGWAETDFEGLEKQLLDTSPTVGGTLWGFFLGCVVYHSDLTNRTLHTRFAYRIAFVPASPTSRQQVKDFQNHVGAPTDLNLEEVNFELLPEYSVSD